MSSAIFPTLPGLAYSVFRTPIWSTLLQTAASGKEQRCALWSYPRWSWSVSFSVLRSSITFGEWQAFVGFFNSRQGMFDTFLYEDVDDKSIVGQNIGVGDGVNKVFQLVRTLGGFVEPIPAPNIITDILVNGVSLAGAYSVDPATGLATLTAAPGNGLLVTATFSYYWRCHFAPDSSGAGAGNFSGDAMTLEKFMDQLWATGVSFMSVK